MSVSNVFYNDDYEKAILGSIIQNPIILSKEVVEHNFMPAFFHFEKNRLVFVTVLQLYNAGITPDILSLTQKLQNDNNLDKIGGASFIAELTDFSSVSSRVTPVWTMCRKQSLRLSSKGMSLAMSLALSLRYG